MDAERLLHKQMEWHACVQVFEKGNFAGLEEMKKNERLFNKVAPMGVNDIMMAVQYRHQQRPPLALPIVSFDGLEDATIDRGNMAQWAQYTSGRFLNVPIQGDHYFVASKFREVGLLLHAIEVAACLAAV
jgi:surfactin synthase thioesterase subunit